MTTIITGNAPRIEQKDFKISVARETRNYSAIGLRRQYGIPLEAVCTVTAIENLDLDEHVYVWFEVTL